MKKVLVLAAAAIGFCISGGHAEQPSASTSTLELNASTGPALEISTSARVGISTDTFNEIHALHLTASAAGSKRYRAKLYKMLDQTVVNAVVVDIKEENGYMYIPGIKAAVEAKAYVPEIPDLAEWLAEMHRRHIYTVGRIVTFKDDLYARAHPEAAVHRADNGGIWQDRHGVAWLDPYNHEAWNYDLSVAEAAVRAGFNEIQFDYIRFPTDGELRNMRFVKPYSKVAAAQALVYFLHRAAEALHPMGAKVSIDVFGLTTTVSTGMGIGQLLGPMSREVDYVCPMIYPSHYSPGEYGLPIPNNEPYRVIHLAIRDGLKVLGPEGKTKLRPYFQDFSLPKRGIRYHAKEVRAQIQAAADLGVMNWTLWNARCSYTLDAIRTPVTPQTPITTRLVPEVHTSTNSALPPSTTDQRK